jgi:predicted metal-binding membrane protein
MYSSRESSSAPTMLGVMAVAAAWALALALQATGNTAHISHHALLDHRAWPAPGTLIVFLAAWQLMTAAMMVPSSLPMMGLFARASRRQDHPRVALAAFIAAYFVVWTVFALVALVSDAGLHALVNRSAWLSARPQLITGGVLFLAGAFQFSSLKERCLHECRNPVGFLWRHYGRGLRRSWDLGVRHGIFCLGCCWALMLVMFAVGVGNLAWMAMLTGVMVIEKTTPWGSRFAPAVGATLLIWGAALLAQIA